MGQPQSGSLAVASERLPNNGDTRGLSNMKDHAQHAVMSVPRCSTPDKFMNENESYTKPCSRVSSRSRKIVAKVHSAADVVGQVCRLGVLAAVLVGSQPAAAESIHPTRTVPPAPLSNKSTPLPSTALKQSIVAPKLALAQFGQESASEDVRQIADWIIDTHNNQDLPFLIVDKRNAKVFAFNPAGTLKGASPALLGIALGDDSIPGIGQRKLSAIQPDERTTPAGRFVATLARNLQGTEILWVDYDAAISLHRVITGGPGQRRAERLSTSTTTDNRISYGCINVPVAFYDQFVGPAFKGTNGIVYVLPEIRSMQEIFGSFDVDRHGQLPDTDPLVPAQSTLTKGAAIRLR